MPYDIIIGRDDADKKRFGEKGLINLGKGYVKMGQYTSLSNPIHMDVARSHVVMVAGKRGTGKSYSLGVIAEELSTLPEETSQNIASLMFDTMGIFWTMKFKNEKEKALLAEWNLAPRSIPVRIFAPEGKFSEYQSRNIPIDFPFSLKADEMTEEDWILTFNLNMTDSVAVLIQSAIYELKKEARPYIIEDIIQKLKSMSADESITNAAVNLMNVAASWGIFSQKGTDTRDLIKQGVTTVIDLSTYSSVGTFNVRALVIGLICRKIFDERMLARKKEEIQAIQHGLDYLSFKQEREMPLVWIFLDEAHEMLPKEGKTAATDALIQVLREGRQPGISIVLATQQPGQIHLDAMTQSDVVIAHRVTAAPDINALNQIMQTYLLENIRQQIDDLPNLKGSAIILDDNSERLYPVRIRPKFTWHGGEAPTAIKVEKRL